MILMLFIENRDLHKNRDLNKNRNLLKDIGTYINKWYLHMQLFH